MQPVVINIGSNVPVKDWEDLAKWLIQMLSGLFVLASFALTYWHSVNVSAGDLLLKLEETFSKLGPKLHFLEYKETCYDPIESIFRNAVIEPDSLLEYERKTLMDVDECIRFLYLCTLHAGSTIVIPKTMKKVRLLDQLGQLLYPSRLPQAYYYYLNVLNDQKDRCDLYDYVRTYYPMLTFWLDNNREALLRFGPKASIETSC